MAPTTANKPRLVRRKGRPFTLYLSPELAQQLEMLSRTRRVTKAELVRVALDRLLLDMRNGQLSLPLGMEGL